MSANAVPATRTREQDARERLHAESRLVAASIAYARSGKAPDRAEGPPRGDAYTVEEVEALHNALASVGDFEGLPARRVAVLPERGSWPAAWSVKWQSKRPGPNREAAAY